MSAPMPAGAFAKYKVVGTECDCPECVAMCNNVPCWPTPIEAKRLMDAGYSNSLMVCKRTWPRERPAPVSILSPANIYAAGKVDPFEEGRCIFLTPDCKCTLHALGLKPIEGRIASCQGPTGEGVAFRKRIAKLWDTPFGRKIVITWHAKVSP